MSNEEKKNRNKALAASIAVHSVLLLLILFAIAWRAPNPPLPQYGIEINFGTENVGSGAVQPETTPTTIQQETQQAEQREEQPEESRDQQETAQSPAKAEPVETESPSKVESTVKAKPTEKEVKVTEPVKEQAKEPAKKETEEAKKQSETKATETKKAEETQGKQKETSTPSHGDNKDQVGDKGKEDGTLDAKALYGQQGGGGGPLLELAGWEWDRLPKPQISKGEMGRITFEIKVDDNGDLISYRVLERGVSIEAERACIAELEKLSFIKKSGAIVPPISTGKITFVFRTQ